MLTISQIHKSFKGKAVLKGLSLSVEPGESVALLGSNGSGKSTLFNIIAGLELPDKGEVRFANAPMSRTARANIGFMIDQSDLIDDIAGYDFLRFKCMVYRKPFDKKEADALIDLLFPERNALFAPAGQYSTGMKKKLQLISNLLLRPQMLLLDEPCAGLDFQAVKDVGQLLNEYRQSYAGTMLFASHQIEFIKAVASRIVILKEGQLVYDASIADFHSYAGADAEISIDSILSHF